MTTAPFDLGKALAGHQLVTRDGRPVRDFAARKGWVGHSYPYQAKVSSKPYTYTRAGRVVQAQEDPLDLFLAIEDAPTQPSPRFAVGDLVRHRASGTRGVVVWAGVNEFGLPVYRVSQEFDPVGSTPESVLEPGTPPTYESSPVLQRILADRSSSDQ